MRYLIILLFALLPVFAAAENTAVTRNVTLREYRQGVREAVNYWLANNGGPFQVVDTQLTPATHTTYFWVRPLNWVEGLAATAGMALGPYDVPAGIFKVQVALKSLDNREPDNGITCFGEFYLRHKNATEESSPLWLSTDLRGCNYDRYTIKMNYYINYAIAPGYMSTLTDLLAQPDDNR